MRIAYRERRLGRRCMIGSVILTCTALVVFAGILTVTIPRLSRRLSFYHDVLNSGPGASMNFAELAPDKRVAVCRQIAEQKGWARYWHALIREPSVIQFPAGCSPGNRLVEGLKWTPSGCSLGFVSTDVTPDGLTKLAINYSRVNHLFFGYCRIQKDALASLSGLEELRGLNLAGCQLEYGAAASLARFEKLECFFVGIVEASDQDWRKLLGGLATEDLRVKRCPGVTPELISRLVRLSELTSLAFNDDVDVTSLFIGPPLEHLCALDLRLTTVTEECSRLLVIRCPNVRSLWLEESRFTDDALKHISRVRNLEWLNLSHTSISAEGLHHLQDAPALRHLVLLGVELDSEAKRSVHEMRRRGVTVITE